jgi:6-methylsalicylate decarboxylase
MSFTSATVPAIDAHSHYIPESYRKWLTDEGLLRTDIFPLPSWDMHQHVEDMDRMNIGATVMHLSSPDINWGDNAKARWLARDANEVAAEAVATYPKRFGFYATLPMPDVDASLAEIEYAYDVLHADGIKFFSNSNGVYLGDPRLEPIFAELNRRNAVVTVHPVKAKVTPPDVLVGVPYPLFEFQFDTTRAVANLLFNGTLERNPNIKFVCPHMGALFPVVEGRMGGVANLMAKLKIASDDFVPPDFKRALRTMYYDCAGAYNLPVQIPALKGISSPRTWICGSDYPFTPAAMGGDMLADIRKTDFLSEEEKLAVLRTNALELFPRLA